MRIRAHLVLMGENLKTLEKAPEVSLPLTTNENPSTECVSDPLLWLGQSPLII
jgi:hypothetical protein